MNFPERLKNVRIAGRFEKVEKKVLNHKGAVIRTCQEDPVYDRVEYCPFYMRYSRVDVCDPNSEYFLNDFN